MEHFNYTYDPFCWKFYKRKLPICQENGTLQQLKINFRFKIQFTKVLQFSSLEMNKPTQDNC